MTHWIRKAVSAALLALTAGLSLAATAPAASAQTPPPWPANSVIYTLYPSIFSAKGDFSGVTAQLGRLKRLGITDLWIMPVTPVGQAVNGHPAFGSPYAVSDYYAVNPAYGTPADLKTLVATAHKLGLRVLLDEVLNHTSWDNALITQHPEYYVHSDGNPQNPASIQQAFNFADVAQLNYANADLRTYITHMLQFWLTQYGVDGFRFDTANDPDGPGRMIPADFWQDLGTQLRQTKPNVLLLEEGESPDLAMKPFTLDYGWRMYATLKDVANGGSAAQMEATWRGEQTDFPPTMQHMAIQDDWDTPRDVNILGGPAGAMAAAVFHFTKNGVPLLYNGMEIGNALGGTNPHDPIQWDNGQPGFPAFYQSLIALRHSSPALQQGTMTWLASSVPSQVIAYTRTGGGNEFLVEINMSGAFVKGTVPAPAGARWTQVFLAGAAPRKAQAGPGRFALGPKEFVIFKRK